MRRQAGFWDIDERSGRLSAAGDPLEKLNAVVPWDVFRKPLAKALKRSDGAKGGRPPYDVVLMFKIMVLQALYNLSDEQAEFQIQDRLSFMRFVGLGLGDRVPDAKTIWLFREHLTQARAVDNLFACFDKHLDKAGYLAMGGRIVDPRFCRARLRATEIPHGPVRAHNRHRTRPYQDRHGQSRLQSHPLCLAPGADCACMKSGAAQNAATMPESASGVRRND